jgi:DNA polymerase-3 subunit gamma/tau
MTLLRMLAFRPAIAGASGGQGQARKPAPKESPQKPEPSKAAKPSFESKLVEARAAETKPTENEPKKSKPIESKPSVEAPVAPKVEQEQLLAQVQNPEDWNGLLPNLKLEGPVRELARNIKLESKDGDRWQFLIPETVRHLGSEGMIQKLQTALSSQLGHDVNHTANEPVLTPAAIGENASRQQMNEAELAIEKDPTVVSLKERFGAEIVEDSIQPLQ